MSDTNNNKPILADNIISQHGRWMERLTAQCTGPMSVSILTQEAKTASPEAVIAERGSSEDVFARLQARA